MAVIRRDPALLGQEYEIALDEDSSIFVKVVKSHVNDGYSLNMRDANTDKQLSFEQMCEMIYGNVPPLYSEKDVYRVVGELFESEEELQADESITEWDEAEPISQINHYEHLHQVHQEILSGIYCESHAKVGDKLFLRFGDIIVKCDARWIE